MQQEWWIRALAIGIGLALVSWVRRVFQIYHRSMLDRGFRKGKLTSKHLDALIVLTERATSESIGGTPGSTSAKQLGEVLGVTKKEARALMKGLARVGAVSMGTPTVSGCEWLSLYAQGQAAEVAGSLEVDLKAQQRAMAAAMAVVHSDAALDGGGGDGGG